MEGVGPAVIGHCLRCRENRPMIAPQHVHDGKGHHFMIGRCAACGGRISRPIKGGGFNPLDMIPIVGPILGALGI